MPETKVSHASSLYAAACTHFHQAATILTALSGQSSDENVRAASFLSLLSFLSHTEARPPLFICSPVLLFCLFATTFRHPGVGNDSRVQDELRSDALAGRRSPAPGNRPSSVRFPRPPAFPYCQGHLKLKERCLALYRKKTNNCILSITRSLLDIFINYSKVFAAEA